MVQTESEGGDMAKAKELNKVVRLAIRRAPCSLRALAREADVPHSTLVRIKQRTLNASPETARKLAAALQRWAEACRSAASDLRVDSPIATADRLWR